MRYARFTGILVAAGAVVAGCAGRGGTVPPGAHSGETRYASVTSAQPDTLYVAGGTVVNAFPLSASSTASPTRSISVASSGTVVGIATAADGTVDLAADYPNAATPDCRALALSPGASGSASPLNQTECTVSSVHTGTVSGIRGRGVARDANFVVDVLDTLQGSLSGDYVDRLNLVASPAYDAGSLTLAGTAGSHHDLVADPSGNVFVTSSSAGAPIVTAGSASTTQCSSGASGAATIDRFAPGATGNASPTLTFTVSGRTAAGAVAIDTNNTTLYVAACDSTGRLWVDTVAVPGGNGSVAPSRSLGPFGNNAVTALAVDAANDLYVGMSATNGSGATDVRVYAPGGASGKPAFLRVLQNPLTVVAGRKISGLAISQGPYSASPTPSPTPTPTPIPAWQSKTPLPVALEGGAGAFIGGSFYLLGGMTNSNNVRSAVEQYDASADQWIAQSALNVPRVYPCAGVLGSSLYVVGGNDGTSALSSMEYGTPPGAWVVSSAALSVARQACGIGAIGSTLYAAGGQNSNGPTATVEAYTDGAAGWNPVASMSTPRASFASAVVNGKFYVAGGVGNGTGHTSSAEAYNPVADAWTALPPMPAGLIGPGGGSINGIFYVVGGNNGAAYVNTVYAYDPASNAWTTFANAMPTARAYFASASGNGTYYAAGGQINSGALSTFEILK